ncbi:hypothetical protein ACOME3_004376 [Neoechinorhynchus agilis]
MFASQHNSYSNASFSCFNDHFGDEDVAPYRERTDEFGSIARLIKNKMITGSAVVSVKEEREISGHSQFGLATKQLNNDMRRTRLKLQKLDMLCKSSSLFDDKSKEIDSLVCILKQDTANLNQQIGQLGNHVSHKSTLWPNKAVQAYYQSIVVALQSQLAEVSIIFKTTLEYRSERIRQTANSLEQIHNQNVHRRTIPPLQPDSILMRDENVHIEMGNGDLTIGRNQQLQQQIAPNMQTEILTDRVDEMREIEQTIIDLGQVFQQLAVMVKEQDELVQRIDDSIEHVNLNIDAAHAQLRRYWHSISSNRWLLVKLFIILILFIVLFVVFLV